MRTEVRKKNLTRSRHSANFGENWHGTFTCYFVCNNIFILAVKY